MRALGKMGILSWAIAPIESVIHDLTTPVEEVERIFGVVITAVKDIAQDLIKLIAQIENLFNLSTFESLFVQPFKQGIMSAINGLQQLTSAILSYADIGVEAFGDILQEPVQEAYKLVKDSIQALKAEYIKLINDLRFAPSRLIDDSQREVYSLFDKIDNVLGLIKTKVAGLFNIVGGRTLVVEQNFVGFANRAASRVSTDVNRVGQIAVDDLRDVEHSLANRVRNENTAIDGFVMLLVGGLVIGIISFVLTTGSLSFLIAIIVILVLTVLSYLVF